MQVFLTSFCIFVSKSFHIYISKADLMNHCLFQYSYHSLNLFRSQHPKPFHSHFTTPHHIPHIHNTTNIFSIQTNNHHYYTFLPITTPSIYHSIQILSTKCLCIKYLLTILSHLAKTTLRKEIHRSIVLLTIHSHDPTRT